MVIAIYPTDVFLSKEYDGFAEDEFNMDEISILINQNSDELEIELGEIFEIPVDFYGDIEDDGYEYYDPKEAGKDSLSRLDSGTYKLDNKIVNGVEYFVVYRI